MNKLEELIEKICPNGVEFKELQEICNVSIGEFVHKNKQREDAIYPVFNGGISNTGFYDEYNNEGNKVLVSARGANAGFVNKIETRYWAGNSCYSIAAKDSKYINWLYVYYFLKNNEKNLLGQQQTGSIPAISKKQIESFKIAVPPLEVQCEIVRILDDFTLPSALLSAELLAELKARQKQYEYYKNKIFADSNIVDRKSLRELAENCDNKRKPITSGNRTKGEIPYYGASGIVDYVKDYIFEGDYLLISEDGANLTARKTPIAFSISGKNWVNNHAHVLKFTDIYLQKYVEMYLNSLDLKPYITGAAQPKLNQENLNKIIIPLPNKMDIEHKVKLLEKFDKICNDISEELSAEIEARRKQYEYYRDKLLTFKELKEEK